MTPGRPSSGPTASWLAGTKLQPPAPPGGLIRRPRLVDAISAGLRRSRLVLLSAPAGYGKTSLLAMLGAAQADATVAWLTLGEDDNDWARFLAGLVAAVHRAEPCWGVAAAAQLAAHARPIETRDPLALGRRVISALINDLLESEPRRLVLILDDLHRVREPAVYAMLEYLIDFLPVTLRLVVATRQDPPLPLARLRTQGDLVELRVPELRFSQTEVTSLLNEQLQLDLSLEDLALLQTRLEGWPAGLRIVAASLQRLHSAAERRALINRLPTSGGHLFDYLADEILDRQPAEVQAFLLETSILAELTPSLCQAVTGRSDTQAILQDLKRRNLVVEIAGESGPAFRYHDLLSAFLRQRLAQEQPERLPELHGRAAAAEPSPDRAIDHYLAAELWEEAASAIERIGRQLMHQGLLDTLQARIKALPAAVREAHPRLLSLLGASTWQQGDIEGAELLLRQALSRFEATGDEAGQGEALAELASCAFLLGDFLRLREIVEQALPLPLLPQSRIQLLMGRSLLAYLGGDWPSAAADFEAATRIAQRSDDVEVFLTLASQLLPGCAVLPGSFRRFERVCRQARAYLGEAPTPLHVVVETQLTFLHLLRAEPERTLSHGQRVLDMAEQLHYLTTNVCDTSAALANMCVALGDFAAADRYFETLLHYVELLPAEQTILAVRLFHVGKARWNEGRLREASEVYARMCSAEHPRELAICPPARSMMRGLLELSDGQYSRAEDSLRQTEALCQRLPAATFFLGNPRLMLALLYLEWGRPDAALAELTPVLSDVEQRGTPGLIFIEGPRVTPLLRLAAEHGVHTRLAMRLLAHFYTLPSRQQARVLDTGEVLSARELEILQLLVAGQRNRAIAERLVITENTIKAHLYRIYRKLHVSSRAQAVVRARELGLV